MTKKTARSIAVCLLLAVILVGCSQKEAKRDGKPVIYASFYPIYDLVHQIAGDSVDLRSFMPVEKDPHLWEPTPKDMKRLAEADLLIVNGANLERWLDQVRENLPDLKILVLSESVELITYKGAAAIGDFQYMCRQETVRGEKYKIAFGHTHEDLMRIVFMKDEGDLRREELIARGKKYMEQKGVLVLQNNEIAVEEGKVYSIEMGHESGEVSYLFPSDGKWIFISDRISENILPYDLTNALGEKADTEVLLEGSTSGLDKFTYDPHSWMSPVNAKKYLNAIQDALISQYPAQEKIYKKNKLRAVDAITDLEAEYKSKFKEMDQREFVVTHYAYAYLARDFDLRQFPLQGLISTESPGLKTIRKALDFCNHFGIKHIFYEEGMDNRGALTLAEEIGGEAHTLNSMEYRRVSAVEKDKNYTQIMRDNLEKIYESLKGR